MAKTEKSDRQARIDAIRKQERGSAKRRSYAIVGVCSLIALVLLGIAVVPIVRENIELSSYADMELAEIGAAADVCQAPTTTPADGNQNHIEEGSATSYTTAPPTFGSHYPSPAAMDRKFYAPADRPELGTLVHNLEHGYTVLWYDGHVAADDTSMREIRAMADKFPGTTNQRNKFKAAPWTAADGPAFPKGQHVALSHWSAGGSGNTDPAQQVGVTQYCAAPSGAAVDTFMVKNPYTDSPEPLAP